MSRHCPGTSLNITIAKTTAKRGAKLPTVPVRLGPSRRFASKARIVTRTGNRAPTAEKIPTACKFQAVQSTAPGDITRNSSAEVGTLTAAPRKCGNQRSQNCVSTSAEPNNSAESRAISNAAGCIYLAASNNLSTSPPPMPFTAALLSSTCRACQNADFRPV